MSYDRLPRTDALVHQPHPELLVVPGGWNAPSTLHAMSSAEDPRAAVARLTGALERQAEELRRVRSHLGVTPLEASALLRPDDVAIRLAKSRAWVYRNQQALGGFRVGGQVRFTREAIDSYVARCRKQPGSTRPTGSATPRTPLLPVVRTPSTSREGPKRPADG